MVVMWSDGWVRSAMWASGAVMAAGWRSAGGEGRQVPGSWGRGMADGVSGGGVSGGYLVWGGVCMGDDVPLVAAGVWCAGGGGL